MGLNFTPSKDAELVERVVFEGLPEMGFFQSIFGSSSERSFLKRSLEKADVYFISPFSAQVSLPNSNLNDFSRLLNEPYSGVFTLNGFHAYALSPEFKISSHFQAGSPNPSKDSSGLAEMLAKDQGKIVVLDRPSFEGMPELTSIYLPGGETLLYQKEVLLASDRARFGREVEGSIKVALNSLS